MPFGRPLARLAGAIAALAIVVPGPAAAQAFQPTWPIELVVHSSIGGGSDVFARALVEIMNKEKLLTQPIQIVNHTKAAGIEAMDYLVAKKGADHILAIFTNTWVATPGWRTYLKENQVEDVFLAGPELGPFFDQQIDLMRTVLRAAGVEVTR